MENIFTFLKDNPTLFFIGGSALFILKDSLISIITSIKLKILNKKNTRAINKKSKDLENTTNETKVMVQKIKDIASSSRTDALKKEAEEDLKEYRILSSDMESKIGEGDIDVIKELKEREKKSNSFR